MPIETKKGKIIVPNGNGFIQILPEVSTDAEASSTSVNPLASDAVKSEIQAERDRRLIVTKDDAETSMANLKTNGLGVCLEPECFRCTIQTDAEAEGARTGAIPFSFVGTDQTITVDWGDGTVDYLTAADYEPTDLSASIHEYAEPGKYQISVYADSFENEVIDAYNAYEEGYQSSPPFNALCLHLKHFRDTLVSIDKPIPSVLGTYLFSATQTQKTRYPDSILESYGWGVNNVFGISYDKSYNNRTEEIHINYPFLFARCKHLVSVPELMLSKTTISKGSSNNLYIPSSSSCFMIFSNCYSLKKVPDSIFRNISLSTFDRVFEKCTALESIGNVFQGQENASSAADCFEYCDSLKSVSEDLFTDASEIKSFSWCFSYCKSLETVPSNLFANQTAATSFQNCFFSCTSLQSVPSGLFSRNAAATSFNSCFFSCTSLQSIPSDLFSANSSATNFNSCFYNCTSLQSIPSDIFSGCTKAKEFYSCFSRCESIRSIPSGLFSQCPDAELFSSTFYSCISLQTVPSGLFSGRINATSFSYCFYACSALQAIPSGMFDGCTEATTFSNCFSVCSSLQSISSGLFDDCTKAENFASCFSGCSALQSIPSGLFDSCTEATTFDSCFSSCTSLQSIPSGLFDSCTEVASFNRCFFSCDSIESIPDGLFDNNVNATTFDACFNHCDHLAYIPENILLYNTAAVNVEWCFRAAGRVVNAAIHVGSRNITLADDFISYSSSPANVSYTVYVPAGSTTETTFRNASSLNGMTVVAE